MKLILGLGNPGEPYRDTRHNAGWMVLDRLAEPLGIRWKRNWRCPCDSGIVPHSTAGAVLVRPRTFMNRSGHAAACVLRRWRAETGDLLVVVDDLDLPLGRIRIRSGGGAGGHNGLRSVIGELGTEAFPRLRVGIGPRPDGADVVSYVLAPFEQQEQDRLKPALERAAEAAKTWWQGGMEAAMNEFNA